ncbi:MAG: DegV family protein [Dehalococcoidia bacterium]|nr:DegV family protein [Dehalococcoidia bacterium]
MALVRIVTDSTADLDHDSAASQGVEVVPIHVRWGETSFRDGVDLPPAEFYRLLATNGVHPATAQPSPDDFTRVYASAPYDEGIVSIHISSKISGTCNSARVAKESLGADAPIDIVDSGLNSAGLAMVVLAAARAARDGGTLAEVSAEARRACEETRMIGLFDTMKYLVRGGRISPTIGLAARFLRVKPILTFREGEIVRAGLVRSRQEGMQRLLRVLTGMGPLRSVIVSHSTSLEEVTEFVRRVTAEHRGGVDRVLQMGAALGVHGGPGMIIVAARRAEAT